jgi:enoyl-CoA hydratase/carnithine racemase
VAIELTARSGSTFNLHLNNPDRLNATTLEDWSTLRTLLAEAAAEPALRALLITTQGRHFCAGADLELLLALTEMGAPARREALAVGSALVRDLIRFPARTMAAVDGAAVGIGACLALACDEVLVTPEAKFSLIFTAMGIPAGDMAAPWLIKRRVGGRTASRLLLSAIDVDAGTSIRLGLADELLPSASRAGLIARLQTESERIHPEAARTTKRQLLELEGGYDDLDTAMERQLDDLVDAVGGDHFRRVILDRTAARRARSAGRTALRRL